MSTPEHGQGGSGLTLSRVSSPLRHNSHLVAVENNKDAPLTTDARARRLGAEFGLSVREKSTYIMSPLAGMQVGYNVVDSG